MSAVNTRHGNPWVVLLTALLSVLGLARSSALAATSSPNDPFFTSGQQWSLTGKPASINAPPAWCVSSGAGVVIADLDTGADFGHPDLAGQLVVGANFTSGRGDPANPDATTQAPAQ